MSRRPQVSTSGEQPKWKRTESKVNRGFSAFAADGRRRKSVAATSTWWRGERRWCSSAFMVACPSLLLLLLMFSRFLSVVA